MAKFKECGHYAGACPCLTCREKIPVCGGCLTTGGVGYVVDTAELCEAAREYCESGRDTDVQE